MPNRQKKNAKNVYTVMEVVLVVESRKERIRTEQVKDKEGTINVRLTDVLQPKLICTV